MNKCENDSSMLRITAGFTLQTRVGVPFPFVSMILFCYHLLHQIFMLDLHVTGLPSSVCVMCCASVMAASVFKTRPTKGEI